MSQHVLNDSSQSSSNVLPNAPSNAPSDAPSASLTAPPSASSSTPLVPSPADFNILASMFQDMAQVFLKYGISESCASVEGEIKAIANAEPVANANAEKSSQQEMLEQMGQSKQLGEQLEQSEQAEPEQPSEKEQSITFSYNTEGKRTPTFFKMYGDTLEQYRQGEFHDEIRCFHLSESKVREERALLRKHGCTNLTEFLCRTYDELSMFVNLLCNVDKGIDLPEKTLQQTYYNMELLLEDIEELYTHMENYEQVHTELIHKELVHTAVIPA